MCGDYISDDFSKIYKQSSLTFGIAGTVSAAMGFLEWAKDRTKPKPRFDDDFSVLEIHPSGNAYLYDNNIVRIPVSVPCAIGSGAQAAMAAMLCGKTAKEAVTIAKKLDEYTGGKIKTATIKP